MFIELTDHLRCPGDHAEAYLVLLPGRMDGREVVEGTMGCPACGLTVPVASGVADFGGAPESGTRTALTAEALQAFFGLGGPGGYVALGGAAAGLAAALQPLLAGVRLVAVNPPSGPAAEASAGVVRAPRWPLKQACLRGVALAGGLAADPAWVETAAASVLPGLRLVVDGPRRDLAGFRVLAEAGSVWVASRG